MATKIRVMLTGFAAIDRRLALLPLVLQKKYMRQAMRSSNKEVIEPSLQAKMTAHHRSGDLAKSIKIRAAKRSRRRFGVQTEYGKEKREDGAYYGSFFELGTKQYKRHPEGYRALRTSLYNNKREIHGVFRREMLKFLSAAKVTGKGAP